jgi:hypothetical protein
MAKDQAIQTLSSHLTACEQALTQLRDSKQVNTALSWKCFPILQPICFGW